MRTVAGTSSTCLRNDDDTNVVRCRHKNVREILYENATDRDYCSHSYLSAFVASVAHTLGPNDMVSMMSCLPIPRPRLGFFLFE